MLPHIRTRIRHLIRSHFVMVIVYCLFIALLINCGLCVYLCQFFAPFPSHPHILYIRPSVLPPFFNDDLGPGKYHMHIDTVSRQSISLAGS